MIIYHVIVSLAKQSRKSLIAALAFGLIAMTIVAQSVLAEGSTDKALAAANSIRYTDDMWSEEFLGIEAEEPAYLPKDMEFAIPAPPANDSSETAEELKLLFQYEKEMRTPEQVKKIIIEQKGTTDLVFGLGVKIPGYVQDKIDMIRYDSTRDLDYRLYRLKRQYKRPRPTQLAPELTTVIPVPGAPAYPSGHAAIAWMGGLIYSYIDPDNKEKYMKYAGDVGLRRCISGIHYPSDSEGSRILADKVFAALLEVPEYRQRLDDAKKSFDGTVKKQQAATDVSFDEIRFAEESWTPDNLSFITDGPAFLSRDLDMGVAPPPANSSKKTQGELQALRDYAATKRTPDQIALIKDENGVGGALLTGGPLIAQFDNNMPLQMLLPKAYKDATYFVMLAKKHYARPRPTQLAPDLTTVVAVPGHAAYPSGHATQMRMVARVLGAIDEAHKNEYEQMAYEIAQRREIAGLHYASDTAAGIKLADAVFEKLMETPAFRTELDAARAAFGRKYVENKSFR